MLYAQEFKDHWRAWVGAALGLSVGASTQAYTNSLFAPHMIAEFGWDRATFALQGTLSIFMFIVVPFAGRLTDLLGVKRIATFGVIALPMSYVAFSLQTGSLPLFFGLSILKMVIGAFTASLVYCRVVALSFNAARGLALAICASAPALLMTVFAPLIGSVIASHDWRVGYQVMAATAFVVGIIAVMILPPSQTAQEPKTLSSKIERKPGTVRKDYGEIFRNKVFWIIFGAMFLCNAPNVILSSQFGLMLIEQKISMNDVPWMLSIYAASVVVGRFVCGLALDKYSVRSVAFLSMAMPAVGLALLGADLQLTNVIIFAIIFVGLAQGAEGDLVAYIVAQYFPSALYGSVAGLISAGLALSAATGAITLSMMLRMTDSFLIFMQIMAVGTLIGASLFLFIRKNSEEIVDFSPAPEKQSG